MAWCSCCNGQFDYNIEDLPPESQILPKIKNRVLSQDLKFNEKNNLFPEYNTLFTFGNITYSRNIDLNNLIGNSKVLLNVKSIQFGDSHSLMLITSITNQKSYLFGCGSNENGQLGIDYVPNDINSYNKWREISLDNYINKGLMFWNKIDYEVYDIGVGNNFSLITIQYPKDKSLALYRFELKKEDKYEIFKSPNSSDSKKTIYKEYFDQSENGGIKKVGVFGDRVLILTNDNSLYIKGILYNMDIATDYALYLKLQIDVINLYMGMNHCLLLAKNNEIYGLGHNEYGEFGIIEENCEERKIYKNDYFSRNHLSILKIATGARHTLVLCSDGNVYCFGDNSDGQCCGLEKLVIEPEKVSFDNYRDVFIVDICCGFNHSIAKAKDGKVYFWGDSAWGKLGVKETRVDQYTPIEMSDMKVRNVVGLFAGPMQSAIFTSGGL